MFLSKIAKKADSFLLINRVTSKRCLFEKIAVRAEKFSLQDNRKILELLLQRERLGSTSIGNGVAIPHFCLDDIKETFAIITVLKEPIDYDTIDSQPVDIAIFLAAPTNQPAENLRALSSISLAVKEEGFLEGLRNAKTEEEIHSFITKHFSEKAA